jgi:DNA-directed RNA polymerase subunit delta
MDKRRIIIDYNNSTPELLALLNDKYPEGFDPGVMVTYTNAKGELVRAVPLETEDTKYLFKISIELQNQLNRYLDDLETVPSAAPVDSELEDDSSDEEEESSDDPPAEDDFEE